MLGELNPDQVEQLLRSEYVGRIGCHLDGRTYVVPVTYVYENGAVFGHTGEGLKLKMLRANPRCCFEVDHLDTMANWRSVIAQGSFQELRGAEAGAAMQRLVSRLRPLVTSESSQPSHGLPSGHGGAPPSSHQADLAGQEAITYRIVLGEVTGRYEKR